MHEDDMKSLKKVEEILEKELRAEMKKVVDANAFAPGQSKTITDAVCLMLKMKEYEEWLDGMGMSETSMRNAGRMNYNPSRNYISTNYQPAAWGGSNPFTYGNYSGNYSGHSTRDRMVARLEDLMGDVKNEYEAQMIRDAINYIQRSESR